MRLVIQRVFSGRVTVAGEVVGEIGPGVVVFLGINRNDTENEIEWAVRKMLNTRIWPDEGDKPWSKSVAAMEYSLLIVSQFTLYAVLKGNKPDFHRAMGPDPANELYLRIVEEVRRQYVPERVQTGRFGERMQVDAINDGPVTLILESNSSE